MPLVHRFADHGISISLRSYFKLLQRLIGGQRSLSSFSRSEKRGQRSGGLAPS